MTARNRHFLRFLPLAMVFCVFISIPLIKSVLDEDLVSSSQENRRLSQFPAFPQNAEELKRFPRQLGNYYADHFGFREDLYGFYFEIMSHVGFSSTERRSVTQGQDGWLFLGSIRPGQGGYSDPMGDAMNINLYTLEELERFARYITAIQQWLAVRGIEYVYVITPIKHTVYADKLPDYIEKRNDSSATDQLMAYLRANTTVTLVDLRNPLIQEREQHDVYYRTDSHWNSYGANVAQYEIMKQISTLFPGQISPFRLSPEQFEMKDIAGGDLARNANITDVRESSPQPVFDDTCEPVKENPDAGLREPFTMVCDDEDLTTLIFRDSYFSALEPYFSRQFNRSTYIWNRLELTTLAEFVEKEKPDIVIDQVVERVLPYLPNGRPFLELE